MGKRHPHGRGTIKLSLSNRPQTSGDSDGEAGSQEPKIYDRTIQAASCFKEGPELHGTGRKNDGAGLVHTAPKTFLQSETGQARRILCIRTAPRWPSRGGCQDGYVGCPRTLLQPSTSARPSILGHVEGLIEGGVMIGPGYPSWRGVMKGRMIQKPRLRTTSSRRRSTRRRSTHLCEYSNVHGPLARRGSASAEHSAAPAITNAMRMRWGQDR